MNAIDIESKIWNFSGTGTKVHAFVGGVALCRKNIKDSEITRPNHRDFCLAREEVRKAAGTGMCAGCLKKFEAEIEREEAFQERLAASMEPSIGEGDYLPTADAVPAEETADQVYARSADGETTLVSIEEGDAEIAAAEAAGLKVRRDRCGVGIKRPSGVLYWLRKVPAPVQGPIRVVVTLMVDVDADAWTLDYGVEGRREISRDVKDYIRNMINEGPAGFDNMTLVNGA